MQKLELTPAQRLFLGEHVEGFSENEWSIELAGEAGSVRRFIRLREPGAEAGSYVLVIWDSRDEDWKHFLGMVDEAPGDLGLFPRVYAADAGHGLILEEDLGSETLRRFCMAHRTDMTAVEEQYRHTLEALARWHAVDPVTMPSVSARAMDKDTFLWESGYFARRCVTEYLGREKLLDSAWEEERERLATIAANLPHVCMHRDFQSDNIMVAQGEIRFIDFQGARLGPAAYDLASLLYDPYMELLTEPMVERLVACYTEQNPGAVSPEAFRCCAMQRLMQAAGAYGYLSLHKGKGWFRHYIPRALQRLGRVVEREEGFPALRRIVEECCAAGG